MLAERITQAVPPGREQIALLAFLGHPYNRELAARLAAPYSTEGQGSGLAVYQPIVDGIKSDAAETETIAFRAGYYLAMLLKPRGPSYRAGDPHAPTQVPGPPHVPRVVEGQIPKLNPVCVAAFPAHKGWRSILPEWVQNPVKGLEYFQDPLSTVCIGVDARGKAFEAKPLPFIQGDVGALRNPVPWIPQPEAGREYQQFLVAPDRYMRNRMLLVGWEDVGYGRFRHPAFPERAFLDKSYTMLGFEEDCYR